VTRPNAAQDELVDYTLTRENGLVAYDVPLKDLSRFGRDLHSVVVIDVKPSALQTDNMLLVSDWDGDRADSDLLDVVPFIECTSLHCTALHCTARD
jgi:TFIIF-interacting CTD phosphatase-like protein